MTEQKKPDQFKPKQFLEEQKKKGVHVPEDILFEVKCHVGNLYGKTQKQLWEESTK
jgi:hypothetical protein